MKINELFAASPNKLDSVEISIKNHVDFFFFASASKEFFEHRKSSQKEKKEEGRGKLGEEISSL